MDIEEVAKEDPSAIHKYTINLLEGLKEERAAEIVDGLGLNND